MNWIPVKNRLPDNGIEVLIFCPTYGVVAAEKLWKQGWKPNHWSTAYDSRLEMNEVTHWMPLPEPPLVEQ